MKIATALVSASILFWLLSVINCIVQLTMVGFMIYSGVLGWWGGVIWWLSSTMIVDALLIIHIMKLSDSEKIKKYIEESP